MSGTGSSTREELATHLLCTADTGATSHVTPHKHWLCHYISHRTHIHLSNGQVVYSEGAGSVVFATEVRGESVCEEEFTRVLLYLVRQCDFTVHIYPDRMDFDQQGSTLLCADIRANKTAYLTGIIILAVESAQLSSASTLPLHETLWHRRLAQYHIEGIRKLSQSDVVTGLTVKSHQQADPIYEPCNAGKFNAAPFPTSPNCASQPFKVAHSEAHPWLCSMYAPPLLFSPL